MRRWINDSGIPLGNSWGGRVRSIGEDASIEIDRFMLEIMFSHLPAFQRQKMPMVMMPSSYLSFRERVWKRCVTKTIFWLLLTRNHPRCTRSLCKFYARIIYALNPNGDDQFGKICHPLSGRTKEFWFPMWLLIFLPRLCSIVRVIILCYWHRWCVLLGIIADLDVAHVFNVSPQEKEIVEHPYSCYVLGRSGTGWVPVFKVQSTTY